MRLPQITLRKQGLGGSISALGRKMIFSPNGNPLRAKGSLSLTEAISSRETQAKKKNQKAEGKFVTFKQGDSLIGLCAKEYKNSGYAPMIASINNLISFRDIKPGTQLWFPKI